MRKFKILSLTILFLCLLSLVPREARGENDTLHDRIEKMKVYARETLFQWGSPNGVVGIGYPQKGPPWIVVHIAEEKYRDLVPEEIMGFKVKIEVVGWPCAMEETGDVVPLDYTYPSPVNRKGVVRPLSGGISLGVPENAWGGKNAGTLGVCTNNPYILSCAHVIAYNWQMNHLPLGTSVLQPGPSDGGTEANKVGTLANYIDIKFWSGVGPIPWNYADAAVATPTVSRWAWRVLAADNKNTYPISSYVTVNDGDPVRMSGKNSGVVTSHVAMAQYEIVLWGSAYFTDIIAVVKPFGTAGDSGSPVDKNGGFVGLVFGMNSQYVVVCKAVYIVNGLGIW